MKKSRILSGLLVLTMLSTCVISGTFAKYVSTASANDTARVAKWGVAITAQGNLFGKNYKTGTESIPTTEADATKLSVKSEDTSEVVAPGTKSEHGFKFDINGTPEVRTDVTITATAQDIYLAKGSYAIMQEVKVDEVTYAALVDAGLYTEASGVYSLVSKAKNDKGVHTTAYVPGTTYYALSNFVTVAEGTEGKEGYYPVVYANTNTAANDTKITEIAKQIVYKAATAKTTGEGESAVTNYYKADGTTEITDGDSTTAKVSYSSNKIFDPNTNLAANTALNLGTNNISWSWPFQTGTTDNAKTENDKKDTILGELTAGSTVKVVKCSFADGETTLASNKVTSVSVLTTGTDGIVKTSETEPAEVGSTVTSFTLEITATQVD